MPASVVALIEGHLQAREARREELYRRARGLRRRAQGAMLRLHDGAPDADGLAALAAETRALTTWLAGEGRGDEGLARDALQESVEAALLGAVVAGSELAGPAELGVDPEIYLLGLGDLVGEVRRLVLARLQAGELPAADALLLTMEALFRTLLRFDTTRAIVALKPKQDAARALLERTRGEVTLAHLLARGRTAGGGGA